MKKNWHIIYTKANCEKKIAALLTKRKIEKERAESYFANQKLGGYIATVIS